MSISKSDSTSKSSSVARMCASRRLNLRRHWASPLTVVAGNEMTGRVRRKDRVYVSAKYQDDVWCCDFAGVKPFTAVLCNSNR